MRISKRTMPYVFLLEDYILLSMVAARDLTRLMNLQIARQGSTQTTNSTTFRLGSGCELRRLSVIEQQNHKLMSVQASWLPLPQQTPRLDYVTRGRRVWGAGEWK